MRILGRTGTTADEIPPEDLDGRCVVKVRYNGLVCKPLESEYIIARIEKIDNLLISAAQGPILALLQYDHVDYTRFAQTPTGLVYNNSVVVGPGTLIIIKVLSVRVVQYDTRIMVLGALHDIASQEQSEEYFWDSASDPISKISQLLKRQL